MKRTVRASKKKRNRERERTGEGIAERGREVWRKYASTKASETERGKRERAKKRGREKGRTYQRGAGKKSGNNAHNAHQRALQ